MKEDKPVWERHRVKLQAIAFILIMLSPVGLYFTVEYDIRWATLLLMGLVALGMAIGLWVS